MVQHPSKLWHRGLYTALLLLVGASLFSLFSLFKPSNKAPKSSHSNVLVTSSAKQDTMKATPPAAIVTPYEQTSAGVKALAPSLQGTEVDGELLTDASGRLLVGPGLRMFFDYFLSASGEESAAEIRARIVAEIEARLPKDAAREAIALFDSYVEYRERASRLYESGGIPEDLAGRLSSLQALRRQVFGNSDAAALFGDEEARDEFALRGLSIDSSLSTEEKDALQSKLDAQLPANLRAAREETTAPLRLAKDEAALREADASPEDLWVLRESYFGTEAADRLAKLDSQRAEWNRRVEEFHAARLLIIDNSSLSEAAKKEAIQVLLDASFTPLEQRRVVALEAMPK
jgi:lipase chaperone LimK